MPSVFSAKNFWRTSHKDVLLLEGFPKDKIEEVEIFDGSFSSPITVLHMQEASSALEQGNLSKLGTRQGDRDDIVGDGNDAVDLASGPDTYSLPVHERDSSWSDSDLESSQVS